MPIPIQNEVPALVSNAVVYSLSISSRISGGRLAVTAGVSLSPANCTDDVWTDTSIGLPPKGVMIPDIEQYAIDNPDMAELVGNAWSALNLLVNAINTRDKVL
jgi:hypothetical protein